MAKKILQWLMVLVAFMVLTACGGGGGNSGDKNNTQHNTPQVTQNKKTITGYVIDDPVVGATVTLYTLTGDKVDTTKTDKNGRFIFNVPNDEIKQLTTNGAYIKVVKNGKILRGLIESISFDGNNNYNGEDTYISQYSEAVFKIKDTLKLDINTTKEIYKNFLMDYKNGIYNDKSASSYAFAFKKIINDLASNIKSNIYNNKPLYKLTEIQNKIKTLNTVNLKNVKKASLGYSIPLVYIDSNNTFVSIINFKDYIESNSSNTLKNSNKILNKSFRVEDNSQNIILNLKKYNTSNGDSIYSINSSKPNIILKDVKLINYQSNSYGQGDKQSFIYDERQELELKNFILQYNHKLNKEIQKMLNWKNIDVLYKNGKVYLTFDIYVPKADEFIKSYNLTLLFNENKPITYGAVQMPNINKIQYINTNVSKNDIRILNLKGDGKTHSLEPIDITDIVQNKHSSYTVQLVYSKPLDLDYQTIVAFPPSTLEKSSSRYLWIDWNKYYDNATVAKLTLKDTRAGVDTTNYGDNVYVNKIGHEAQTIDSTTTHRIIDFDKIVTKKFYKDDKWQDTNYSKTSGYPNLKDDNDNRTPLLLVHGWEGGPGQTSPTQLLNYKDNEFSYWHTFIDYYLATPELYKNYKLYTYHYPSYKHVTFNARMLKKLLDKIKQDNKTVLGRALNNKGIVILAHSMGGLVSRSLIEEHKGLGPNAEKLIKLITLDTPHRGSVPAISAYWITDKINYVTEKGFFSGKYLDTPGVVDMIPDNYDGHYKTNDKVYIETTSKTSGYGRQRRMYEIEKYIGKYDQHYSKIDKKHGIAPEKYNMSPFLNYLNVVNYNQNLAKMKYIYYTAFSESDQISNFLNPIDNDNAMLANTEFINWVGYTAGGAEQVSSSVFSFSPKCTLFYTNVPTESKIKQQYLRANLRKNLSTYFLNRYILIGNLKGTEEIDKCIDNKGVPYRLFYDYDHESVMNGQYNKKEDWDQFIDKPYFLKQSANEYTNFMSYNIIYNAIPTTAYPRELYVQSAYKYFKSGNNYKQPKLTIDEMNNIFIKKAYYNANPLKFEPTFLVMRRDLLNAIGKTDKTPPVFEMSSTIVTDEEQLYATTLKAKDETSDVSYAIEGEDAKYFDINQTTGVLTFKEIPHYENKNIYHFIAKAIDENGNTATKPITLYLSPVNHCVEKQALNSNYNIYDEKGSKGIWKFATSNSNKIDIKNTDDNHLKVVKLSPKGVSYFISMPTAVYNKDGFKESLKSGEKYLAYIRVRADDVTEPINLQIAVKQMLVYRADLEFRTKGDIFSDNGIRTVKTSNIYQWVKIPFIYEQLEHDDKYDYKEYIGIIFKNIKKPLLIDKIVFVKNDVCKEHNITPDAKIDASKTTIIQGESVTLDGSKSSDKDGKIIKYVWKDSNGKTVCTNAQCTVKPTKSTTYTLTVTDNDNLSSSDSITITVKPKNIPKGTLTLSASPSSITLSPDESIKDKARNVSIKLSFNKEKKSCDVLVNGKSLGSSAKSICNAKGSVYVDLKDFLQLGSNTITAKVTDKDNINYSKEQTILVSKNSPNYKLSLVDENYKDNTIVKPSDVNGYIGKWWKLKNVSNHEAKDLILVKDSAKECNLQLPVNDPKTYTLAVNETKTFNQSFQAPSKDGTYSCYFKVKDKDGHYYTVNGSSDIWIKIQYKSDALMVNSDFDSEIKVNTTAKMLVQVNSGNKPYNIAINWGDGSHNTYTQDNIEAVYSHKYTKVGTYQVSLKVTDMANKEYNQNYTLKVSNTVSLTTSWIGVVDAIKKNGSNTGDKSYPITVTNKDKVSLYSVNYSKKGDDKLYYTGFKLPVPQGLITLDKKLRVSYITQIDTSTGFWNYDREHWLKTDTKKYGAIIEDAKDGMNENGVWVVKYLDNGTRVDVNESAFVDFVVDHKGYSGYALEIDNGNINTYQYKQNDNGSFTKDLEQIHTYSDSVGNYLSQIHFDCKGKCKLIIARLQYDLNNDGDFDDANETLILNTANKVVDWKQFGKGDENNDNNQSIKKIMKVAWFINGKNTKVIPDGVSGKILQLFTWWGDHSIKVDLNNDGTFDYDFNEDYPSKDVSSEKLNLVFNNGFSLQDYELWYDYWEDPTHGQIKCWEKNSDGTCKYKPHGAGAVFSLEEDNKFECKNNVWMYNGLPVGEKDIYCIEYKIDNYTK